MLELFSFGDTGWGDQILLGAGMTVVVAVLSFLSGVIVGMIGAGAKLSGSIALRGAADVFTTIVRGVPELLVIYLLFFGLGGAVQAVASVFGYTGSIQFEPLTIGVLAVGIISGAYSTEVLRGAIQTIPAGQIEAARAVGMHRWLIFQRIMLPQIMRYALPGLGNVWQLTLKDTALISVTGLAELMRQSSVAARSTREPFDFYLVAAMLFLVMTTFSNVLFQKAERIYNRGVRRG